MTSLGFIIGLTVAGVFVALGLAGVAVGRIVVRRDLTEDPAFFGASYFWSGAVTLVLTLSIAAVAVYPYDMQYHRYKHIEGTVDVSEARMLGDGNGGTSQNFAVRFRETGDTYRCDDTRCSLVKPGDHLSLWCIREWEYASTPGWACRFDKTSSVTK